MIVLGHIIQGFIVTAIIGGGAWALSPAPKPVEVFTVDRGQLVIA